MLSAIGPAQALFSPNIPDPPVHYQANDVALCATFGLDPRYWADALGWARSANIVGEWLWLLDLTRIVNQPNVFGTLLAALTTPSALNTLEQWGTTEAAGKRLFKLGSAARASPSLLRTYSTIQSWKPAASQLRGTLKAQYLLALFLEGYSAPNANESRWFETMRLWLMVHGGWRSIEFPGDVTDRYVASVATALRIACQKSGDAAKPLLQLRSDAAEFDALNYEIRVRVETELSKLEGNRESNNLRQLFNNIKKVVQREHDSLSIDRLPPGPIFQPAQFQFANERTTALISDLLSNSDDEPATALIESPDEDCDALISATVNPDESPAQQRLSSRAVLLACCEDLQFLPYAWNRPNPFEREILKTWVSFKISDSNPATALVAAYAAVAIATGLSLRRVQDIPITSDIGPDWTLSAEAARFHRLPPRRPRGWEPADKSQRAWTRPFALSLELPLPSTITQRLVEGIQRNTNARTLGEIWTGVSKFTPEQEFTQALPPQLSRITPGMLGQDLPQRLYNATGDGPFARIVSSTSRSGLPASCAYTTWQLADVHQQPSHIGLAIVPDARSSEPELNGAGSRLDPIDSWLAAEIANARCRVDALRSEDDPLGFHNALTIYFMVAYIASSGVRPIRDPIESFDQIDLQERFIYVDDKASGNVRQGRLVPLVGWIPEFLTVTYPRHLSELSKVLANAAPTLSEAIGELTFRKSSARLPLFFLLFRGPNGHLNWDSVSESAITTSQLFRWPLPLNLFRHRITTQLRRRGVDPEIIDALLGHAELGAATYADTSTRTWTEDAAAVRPHLTAAFNLVEFTRPDTWDRSPKPIAAGLNLEPNTTVAQKFGMEAREARRHEQRERTIAAANVEIDAFLAQSDVHATTLGALTSDQIDLLAHAMIFYPNGLPRPTAGLRYHQLSERLEADWFDKDRVPRIRKRYLHATPERSPFNQISPNAQTWLAKTRTILAEGLGQLQRSRLSRIQCAAIASIRLCLTCRITNVPILKAVSTAQDVRIVVLAGETYVEFAPGLGRLDAKVAVRRYQIDGETAGYLDQALDGQPRGKPSLPTALSGIERQALWADSSDVPLTFNDMIAKLAKRVDQVNVQTLPCLVAAYLAGRISTYGLPWRNWLQVRTGKQTILPPELAAKDEDESTDLLIAKLADPAAQIRSDSTNEELQANAKALFAEVRKLISTESGDLPTQVSTGRRRDLARSLNKEIRRWSGKVSPALILLAQWTTALIEGMKNARQHYAMSTAERYLGALAPAMLQVAYRADLQAMSEDDVTATYRAVIDGSSASDLEPVSSRLVDFHNWARTQGVEDPDWSSVPLTKTKPPKVAPGLVTETHYLAALNWLTSHTDAIFWHAAFVVLGAYRFGLRGNEVFWLSMSDWRRFDGQLVVSVSRNHQRAFKTDNAIRQIPLLFTLSDTEDRVIANIESGCRSRFGERDALLLAADGQPRQAVSSAPVKRLANSALATITGITGLTLHDLRHSFANAVSLAIWDPSLPAGWQNSLSGIRTDVESVLLSRHGNSRRRGWAIARLMGHSNVTTSLQSYIHYAGDWAGQFTVDPSTGRSSSVFKTAIDLDTFPLIASVTPIPPSEHSGLANAPSVVDLVKLARLLAMGKPAEEAAIALRIAPTIGVNLSHRIKILNERFHLEPSKRDPHAGSKMDNCSFLSRFGDAAWTRFLSTAQKIDAAKATLYLWPPDVLQRDGLRMIGSSRQILLATEVHYAWAKAFLKAVELTTDNIRCVHSVGASQAHLALARKYGFDPTSPKSAGDDKSRRTTAIYPDVEIDSEGARITRDRCAIILKESDSQPLRSALEFALLACIVISWLTENSNQMTP